jgi:hypothetical protein
METQKPEDRTGLIVIALLAATVMAVVAMWKVQSNWNVADESAPVAMFEP